MNVNRLMLCLLIMAGFFCACREATPTPTVSSTDPPPAATATNDARTGDATATRVRPTPSYVTPPQQEGPYYPLEKPADRDGDLVSLQGAEGRPAGEVIHLAGVVYDQAGQPLSGVTVEIWQTDSNGIYLHPGDPDTARRDVNFQFYGESTTGADGVYQFRTILPGQYEPRPRHIHVKVRRGDTPLLTTQFYFAGEVSAAGPETNLIIALVPAENDAGEPILVGERDIVLP